MLLEEIWTSQELLRDHDQVTKMVEFVSSGGKWTRDNIIDYAKKVGSKASVITISRFPDGLLLAHDGHHRLVATYLAGRCWLDTDEYVLTDWKYEDYLEVNFEKGWVTPFDPRQEVRLPDFLDFKNRVMAIVATCVESALEYIHQNKDKYATPRSIRTIIELAKEKTPA